MAGLIETHHKKIQGEKGGKTCETCGRYYIRRNYLQRFCSRICSIRWWGRMRNRNKTSAGYIYNRKYQKKYGKMYGKGYRIKNAEYFLEYGRQYRIMKNIIEHGE